MRKHVDFELAGFAELAAPPTARLGYANAVLALAPVGYWRSLSSPAVVLDVSGHGLHGDSGAGVSAVTPGALHRDADPAMLFTGDAQSEILVPGYDLVQPGMSIVAWLWHNQNDTGYWVAYRQDTDNLFGGLLLDSGQLQFRVIVDGANHSVRGPSLEPQRWYFIALVLEADGTARVYVDGQEQTGTAFTATNANDGALAIGGRGTADSPSPWVGRLDEIAIFDEPLSATAIDGLFARGRGVFAREL